MSPNIEEVAFSLQWISQLPKLRSATYFEYSLQFSGQSNNSLEPTIRAIREWAELPARDVTSSIDHHRQHRYDRQWCECPAAPFMDTVPTVKTKKNVLMNSTICLLSLLPPGYPVRLETWPSGDTSRYTVSSFLAR